MNIESLNRARNITLSAILAMGLSLPAAGLAYAADDDADDTTQKVKDKLNNLFKDEAEDENTPKKSESVYVFANADGSVKNTVVTDWLKNATEAAKLHDISSLTDIQNTEGKQGFEAKGQSLVWDAEGGDIYYQGNTDKAAPVELKITYWLDGKETPASDMAGKSGHVKIRFDYKNNSYSTEYVDGAARTVYTPFVCVTGMMLDNDIFSNVKVKNAKSMNDGDRTLVGGYALPGLQEDLDVDTDTVEFPTYFEIEADVENFEMGTTATLVSSNLLDNMNTDELDTDEIGDKLNELSDAMGQLIDGTSQLYDGMKKLDDGGKKLDDGLGQLNEKAPALADGAEKLAEGSEKLASGADTLADGTGSLADGANTLAEGTGSLADGAGKLSDGTGALVDGADQLVAGNQRITDGLDQLVNGTTDKDGNKTSAGLKDAAEGVGTIKDGISGLTEEDGSLDQLQAAEKQIASGVSAAAAGITQYVAGIDQVSQGLSSAKDGLAQAQDALSGLSGLPALKDGIAGNKQLVDATAAALSAIEAEGIEDETLKAQIQAAKQYAEQAQVVAGKLSDGGASIPDAETISDITESVSQLSGGLDAAIGGLGQVENGDGTASNPGLNGIAEQLGGENGAAAGASTIAEKLGDVKDGLSGAVSGLDTLDSGLNSAVNAIGTTKDSASKQGKNATLLGGNNDVTSGLKTLKGGASQLDSGASSLAEGATKVDKGASSLAEGADKVNQGASSVAEGAGTLSESLAQLNESVPALVAGIEALKEGSEALSDGIGSATEGTEKLKDGIQQLNDEAIQKIIDAYNDNLAGLGDRLKATVNAGKAYDTFTGKSDAMAGSVKFIYETDAIEVADGE